MSWTIILQKLDHPQSSGKSVNICTSWFLFPNLEISYSILRSSPLAKPTPHFYRSMSCVFHRSCRTNALSSALGLTIPLQKLRGQVRQHFCRTSTIMALLEELAQISSHSSAWFYFYPQMLSVYAAFEFPRVLNSFYGTKIHNISIASSDIPSAEPPWVDPF